jgi:hypothetical protein
VKVRRAVLRGDVLAFYGQGLDPALRVITHNGKDALMAGRGHHGSNRCRHDRRRK